MTGNRLVRIYESELDVIFDETQGYSDIETGGSLFGLFSHGGDPTVHLATRPTERAVRKLHSLELDPQVTFEMETILWERFGTQCLGMWHSHHSIGLYEPSSGDRERTRRYGQKFQRPRYVEIIANFTGEARTKVLRKPAPKVLLTPYFYLDSRILSRSDTEFHVLPGESPLRHAVKDIVRNSDLHETLRPAPQTPRGVCRLGSSAKSETRWPRSPGASDRPSGESALISGEYLPIPDLVAYLNDWVQPLLGELSRDYTIEATPLAEERGFKVAISRPRHHARISLLLAWDGSAPVVFSCTVYPGSGRDQAVPWAPNTPDEKYMLRVPLDWGIKQIDRLP
ncbi:hypothetical protein [Streptomyces griseorubiginosus]|uniref:hypothetical protein n=1 Tax=Streptomyces griseorubiginosus TaxID=67304 RepID=UPI001AD664FF|nr:hypothetical protein [Streptomyces griseorubiginosus]MBO4258331.1 hypothetical protein [Streptomyces griseorubiginosus]